MIVPDHRTQWRPHALDGALLWFHPATGTHVRWDAPQTRDLRRRAPRLVLFGITNRCNLTCGFCSRDTGAASAWSADAAFELLAALERAGTLEVSFGGGEPLAFAGFESLIERLGATTRLALHLTTNGALLSDERARRLRPWIGEVRLSIYDDTHWPQAAARLRDAGLRFGANVLLRRGRVSALSALLERLAALGCADVAILRYLGESAEEHLTREEERDLAAILRRAPLTAQLSGCFGDRLHEVPRLVTTSGDCGAGRDFVTLTSDRRLKSCSFHEEAFPIATAADVLRLWGEETRRLQSPARRSGCGRPASPGLPQRDGVRIWRSFSGNNSGACVLVGRFSEVADARAYLDALLPGFAPAERYTAQWRELLSAEGLDADGCAPEEMVRVGATVMLHTSMAVDDDFPQLRALLWKRGGVSVYSGVHEHDQVRLIAALGFKDAARLAPVQEALLLEHDLHFHRHGDALFGELQLGQRGSEEDLRASTALLERIATAHGATVAAELMPADDPPDLTTALSRRAPPPGRCWVWATFPSGEEAQDFARTLEGERTVAASAVLVPVAGVRASRLGWLAHRAGGLAELLTGDVLTFEVSFWRDTKEELHLDVATLTALLRPYLWKDHALTPVRAWRSITLQVTTAQPQHVLPVLEAMARTQQARLWLRARAPDPLAAVLHRLCDELRG